MMNTEHASIKLIMTRSRFNTKNQTFIDEYFFHFRKMRYYVIDCFLKNIVDTDDEEVTIKKVL